MSFRAVIPLIAKKPVSQPLGRPHPLMSGSHGESFFNFSHVAFVIVARSVPGPQYGGSNAHS